MGAKTAQLTLSQQRGHSHVCLPDSKRLPAQVLLHLHTFSFVTRCASLVACAAGTQRTETLEASDRDILERLQTV